MIEFSKSYKVGDRIFATLGEAQCHELGELIGGTPRDEISAKLVTEADKVINILSTNAKSRPRARKANGGTKTRTRKPSAPAVPEGNGAGVIGKGVVS